MKYVHKLEPVKARHLNFIAIKVQMTLIRIVFVSKKCVKAILIFAAMDTLTFVRILILLHLHLPRRHFPKMYAKTNV